MWLLVHGVGVVTGYIGVRVHVATGVGIVIFVGVATGVGSYCHFCWCGQWCIGIRCGRSLV